ncbi:sensor histidine kinase [Ktedonosporobacter rubrisoli]|nr:ATP-binding protein [Ktedonosporobacter rubrisoli]
MKPLLRHLSPPGIRMQLTLWYTLVFAFLLAISGYLLYKHLEAKLDASLDSNLQTQAQQIAKGISYDHGTIRLHGVARQLPDFTLSVEEERSQHVDVAFSVLVRLLDSRGTPLHETPAFENLMVPEASVTQPLQGASWHGTIWAQDGQEVQLYSQALSQNGKPYAVIQIGQPLGELHHTLQNIARELFMQGGLILLCSALGSYWLAARALAPIQQLTRAARDIKRGDLQQRVPVPRSTDEVHFLASTFNEMIASLEEIFRRQRRFVADASHELRTPVTAIRSKTDLALLQADLPAEYAQMLQEIKGETERLGRLISDLLALARGDEHQTHFELEPVSLDRLVQAVASTAEALALERGIELQVQAAQHTVVLGDEARLIQVVMNLLDNALRYTEVGGSVILLVEHDEVLAHLMVKDTGSGIAPEHLPHIFERFYRADPARTQTTSTGSGLGLSIVEWIVTVHKGTVKVESQPGKGSTFSVALPLAPAEFWANEDEPQDSLHIS